MGYVECLLIGNDDMMGWMEMDGWMLEEWKWRGGSRGIKLEGGRGGVN